MSWWRGTLRLRLALWYAAALAIVLVVYATSVLAFLRFSLYKQLDHHLHDHVESAEQLLEPVPPASVRWRQRHVNIDGPATADRLIEVWSAKGTLVCRDPESPAAPASALLPPDREGVETLGGNGTPYLRVMTSRRTIDGIPVTIRVIRSETSLRDELSRLVLVLGLGIPLAIGAATFGGWLLARRALAPLGQMAEQTRAITAERLSERLPADGSGDELDQLAQVFNKTLERLERSFEQLRRFTSDASHELRTPLTALRSVGEVGLREGTDAKTAQEVIASMLEEADQLARLVDTLLNLSRAEAGVLKLHPEQVDLGELAREVSAHLGVLAEEKEQKIVVEADAPVVMSADRLVLRQALINLVDNAIKYSPRGAPIRIVVSASSGASRLDVIDQGIGIAPEHQGRVFDRFYRVDTGRSREHGGAGLGLALARWAAETHGGRIELESTPGRGSTFRIVLPRRS